MQLIVACKGSDASKVELALDNGAPLNARGMWNSTALIVAAQYGEQGHAETRAQSRRKRRRRVAFGAFFRLSRLL
jgi:homoserine kinase